MHTFQSMAFCPHGDNFQAGKTTCIVYTVTCQMQYLWPWIGNVLYVESAWHNDVNQEETRSNPESVNG